MDAKIEKTMLIQAVEFLQTTIEDTLSYWCSPEAALTRPQLENLALARQYCCAITTVQGVNVSEKQKQRFKLAIYEMGHLPGGYAPIAKKDLHIDADALIDMFGPIGLYYVRLVVAMNIIERKCGAALRKNVQRNTFAEAKKSLIEYARFFENEVIMEDIYSEVTDGEKTFSIGTN